MAVAYGAKTYATLNDTRASVKCIEIFCARRVRCSEFTPEGVPVKEQMRMFRRKPPCFRGLRLEIAQHAGRDIEAGEPAHQLDSQSHLK